MAGADVVVIGGGQMGLSLGYYLQRAQADFVILDAEEAPGGAWRHGWDSLRLFSPAGYSSIPGWLMPPSAHGGYPTRYDVIDYLTRYEGRYNFPICRPLRVRDVEYAEESLEVVTNGERYSTRAVISATGTWSHPYIPYVEGRDIFAGRQLHSARYARPGSLRGKSVLVVGGGNSGAQIVAELSQVARTTWVTTHDPLFLPDEVDGRVLFERAVARMKAGPGDAPVGGIGDIVMVAPVKEARARGALKSVRPFVRMTSTGVIWPDGRQSQADAIVWCTGFRPALDHLSSLNLLESDGRVLVDGQRSIQEPRVWLAGYGDWCGPGSATLMGAARTARDIVGKITQQL